MRTVNVLWVMIGAALAAWITASASVLSVAARADAGHEERQTRALERQAEALERIARELGQAGRACR